VFSGGTAMGQFSGGGGVAGVGVAQDAPPPVIIRRQQSEPVNMLAPPMHRRARSDSPERGAASGDDSLHPFHEQLLADTTVREEAERVNASPKKYALALRHVSVLFPERGGRGLPPRAALFNVTLGVRRNECLGVLGVGAVGKSTLLEVMAGALPPTSGEALLLGRPLVPAEVRGVIGFCGQRNALFRELRVSEMLELRAGVIRASRQEVLRVVEALGLSGCLQERCGHLPPPVQRLVSLAIALMATPPVIVVRGNRSLALSPSRPLALSPSRSLALSLTRALSRSSTSRRSAWTSLRAPPCGS
jgi:ABC-type lipoprotein export system ATPase subunit